MWINPNTGKGWSDREEQVIADLFEAGGCHDRMDSIRTMRRRKLDDLKGAIRPEENEVFSQTIKLQRIENKELKRAISKSLQAIAQGDLSIAISTTYSEPEKSIVSQATSELQDISLQEQEETEVVENIANKKRGRKRIYINAAERVAVHRAAQKELSEISFLPLPEDAQVALSRPPRSRPKSNKTRKEALIVRQEGRCLFCERMFGTWVRKSENGVPRILQPQEEHFIPRGELGSRALANLNVACQICNYFKGRRQFSSIEACRGWLLKMWEFNDFRDLGSLVYQQFEFGEFRPVRTAK